MQTQARQIQGLQIEVNGGIVDTQVDAVEITNVTLTTVNATTFSVNVNSLGGIPLAQNGSTYVLAGQNNPAENGLYVVMGKTPENLFILMVATTYNTYEGIMGISKMGTRLQATEGTQKGNVYLMTTVLPFILGVTPVNIIFESNGIQSLQEQIQNLDGGNF